MNWIDWVGYLAAAFVTCSFLISSNIRLLRTINMIGAVFFVAYGVLLNFNLPVIIPNFVIICIQAYHLFFKKEKTVD
ncbi:MAG: uroporphyrinogen decarboxylase [Chitinophagaceae bacterium]